MAENEQGTFKPQFGAELNICLLYTSVAADE